jgi:hypothetical protein
MYFHIVRAAATKIPRRRTKAAGAISAAGHHHEEARWTAPAEATNTTTSICTTPIMVTNKCRTQTAERRRYRRHQERS